MHSERTTEKVKQKETNKNNDETIYTAALQRQKGSGGQSYLSLLSYALFLSLTNHYQPIAHLIHRTGIKELQLALKRKQ